MLKRKRENLYSGVNPHLNSLIQTAGTKEEPSRFPSFHASLIGQLTLHLNQRLPDNYIAMAEESLQLRTEDNPSILYQPTPDVSVFQESYATSIAASSSAVLTHPTWEGTLQEAVDPLDKLKAIRVYEVAAGELGKIIACFEVLSPSNKARGRHAEVYPTKRAEFVWSGIPLIEIDLLHESRPIIPALPIYPQEENAHPYTVIVTDPRPGQHKSSAYGVDVGHPLPTINLPLMDSDAVTIDFDVVYQEVYVGNRFYLLCDYAVEPARFDTYSAADQAIIRAKMTEIAEKYRAE